MVITEVTKLIEVNMVNKATLDTFVATKVSNVNLGGKALTMAMTTWN